SAIRLARTTGRVRDPILPKRAANPGGRPPIGTLHQSSPRRQLRVALVEGRGLRQAVAYRANTRHSRGIGHCDRSRLPWLLFGDNIFPRSRRISRREQWMTNLAVTNELFYERTGMDAGRVERIVGEALAGMDDGELFLEYSQSESVALDDGR